MRRLLAFGTGAAIAGIGLLVVSFIVAYFVVTSLQTDLSNIGGAAAATGPLEYATLEAVFLGIMAAIGYGLITKGLDGIRREEQLERSEVWTEPMFQPTMQATQPGQKGQTPARPVASAERVMTGKPRQPTKMVQSVAPVQPIAPVVAVTPQSAVQPAVQPAEQPAPIVQPATPAPPPETVEPPEQFKPVEPAPPPSWMGPEQSKEESEIQMEHERVQPRFGPLLEEPKTETEVKWEGEAPELPRDVEVLPEPELHGANWAIERESFATQVPPKEPEPEPEAPMIPPPASEPMPAESEAPLPTPAAPEPVAAESTGTPISRERPRARRRERKAKTGPPAQQDQPTDSSSEQNLDS